MKIRNRLSLQFTALVAGILLMFCVIIYAITLTQVRSDFRSQLYERTLTTAYIFLEEDEFPPHVYDLIRERYIRTLPDEVAQLFDMENQAAFLPLSDVVHYSDDLINYIRDQEFHSFRDGERDAIGIFYRDNQGDFVVIVSAINRAGQAQLYNLTRALVTGYIIAVTILFIAGRFFAAQSLRPIPRVVREVNAITPDKLGARLNDGGSDDEIAELARTFNKLLERIQASFDLQQRFVANASHELRTPLTSVIGEVEVTLSKTRTPDEYQEVLQSIHHDALMLHQLVDGLLQIAHTESEKLHAMLETVRLDELVQEAAMITEKKHAGTRILINYADDSTEMEHFLIPAPRSLLLNVFINLMDNAVKFSPGAPTVEVGMQADQQSITTWVSDQGIGIPPEDHTRIFEPFFRSDAAISYQGFGIGLSLVRRVVQLMGGEIRLDSAPASGTTVTIFFKKDRVLMPL